MPHLGSQWWTHDQSSGMKTLPQDPLRCWPGNRIITSPGTTGKWDFAKHSKMWTSGLMEDSYPPTPHYQKDTS